MRTPTEMDEIKANFFSKNEKMLMSQFTASRAIAIMSSSRRKRREEVGDQLATEGLILKYFTIKHEVSVPPESLIFVCCFRCLEINLKAPRCTKIIYRKSCTWEISLLQQHKLG